MHLPVHSHMFTFYLISCASGKIIHNKTSAVFGLELTESIYTRQNPTATDVYLDCGDFVNVVCAVFNAS